MLCTVHTKIAFVALTLTIARWLYSTVVLKAEPITLLLEVIA